MARHRTNPSTNDEDLLHALEHLAGQTLERLKLQQARVELAVALQRSMLPPELPDLPGLRIAAQYAPARDGLDIGGDWYDVLPMPGGAAGFVIGDVQGHDVDAAAFMGQVRIGLRAVTNTTTDPGEILTRTNDLLLAMRSALFATCTFVRFDPATGELVASRAGHIPTVWATADGRCGIDLADGGPADGGPPLGILPGEKYQVTRRRLTQPGVFVLLTDGVVEGPAFPIEEGLKRVARLARANVHADPGELAAEVIKVAELTNHSDDAAVLVIRYDRPPIS